MTKSTLFVLFLFMYFSANAQDKIISLNNDTINCTIVSISKENIFYEIKNNDGSGSGKSIPLSQVEEYNQENLKSGYWQLRLKSGISFSPSYLHNYQYPSSLPDYYNNLTKGIHINAAAHYMVKGYMGLGAEYWFFNTSASGRIPQSYYTMMNIMKSENYRYYVNYFGVSVLFQQALDAQPKIIISESFGVCVFYLHSEYQYTYPEITQFTYNEVSTNTIISGISVSGKFGLTAEYKLFKAISLGLGGDYIWCSLKRASIESTGTNDYDNFSVENHNLSKPIKYSRIDFSFVLRYSF